MDHAIPVDWSAQGFLRYCRAHAREHTEALFSFYQIEKLVRLAGEEPRVPVEHVQAGTTLVYAYLPQSEVERLVEVARARLEAQ
jgi:hypothetical protein